jgi:hypothetical protein
VEEGIAIQVGRVAVDNHHSGPDKTYLKNRSPPVKSHYWMSSQIDDWQDLVSQLALSDAYKGRRTTGFCKCSWLGEIFQSPMSLFMLNNGGWMFPVKPNIGSDLR